MASKKYDRPEKVRRILLRPNITFAEARFVREYIWGGSTHRERQKRDRQYLRSAGWKIKRNLKAKFVDNICEACQEAEVTQVHHTSYKNLAAERNEDLVAVCRACHVAYHSDEIDEELVTEQIADRRAEKRTREEANVPHKKFLVPIRTTQEEELYYLALASGKRPRGMPRPMWNSLKPQLAIRRENG